MASKLLESIGRALALHESRVQLLDLQQMEDYIEQLENTKFLKPSDISQSKNLLKVLYKRKYSLCAFETFVVSDESSKVSKSDDMKSLLNLISNDEFRSKPSTSKQNFEGSVDLFDNTETQKGCSEDLFSPFTFEVNSGEKSKLITNDMDFSTITFEDTQQILIAEGSSKHKESDLELPPSKRFCSDSDNTQIYPFNTDPNFLKTIGFTNEESQIIANTEIQSINYTEKSLRSQLTEEDWTDDDEPDIDKINANIKELLVLKNAVIQKIMKKVDEMPDADLEDLEVPEFEDTREYDIFQENSFKIVKKPIERKMPVKYVPYFKTDDYSSDSDN